MTEQGAATQEIARSVDVAARRTLETAEEVSRVGDATDNTRANVAAVRAVAEELGAVAHRIRDQIEAFTAKSARGLIRLERRRNVPRDAARRDQHRVEPEVAFGVLGMRGN